MEMVWYMGSQPTGKKRGCCYRATDTGLFIGFEVVILISLIRELRCEDVEVVVHSSSRKSIFFDPKA